MQLFAIIETVGVILAALGMCVFGVSFLQANLKPLAMGDLRNNVLKVIKKTFQASVLSFSFAALTGDNIVITVVLGSFISSGITTLSRVYQPFLWTNLGVCSTVFLTLFNLKTAVFYTTGISLLVYSLAKSNKVKLIAGCTLGLSLMLFGIFMMKTLAADLQHSPQFQIYFTKVSESLLFALLLGFLVRFLSQSTFVVVLVGITGLEANLFGHEQLVVLYCGASLASAMIIYIALLSCQHGIKMILLVQLAFHFIVCLVYSFLVVTEHYSGVPLLTTPIGYLGNSPSWVATLFMVFYMLTGIITMILIKPYVISSIYKLFPKLKVDPSQPKYIDWSALGAPHVARDMVQQEELRVLGRFPKYLDFVRHRTKEANKQVQELYDTNTKLQKEVENFLMELGNTKTSSAFFEAFLYLSQNVNFTSAINNELYRFANNISHTSKHASDKLVQLENNFVESVDIILLQLYEGLHDHVTEDDLTLLENMLSPKSHILDGVRQTYLTEETGLNSKEKRSLLATSLNFERIIWLLQEFYKNTKSLPEFHEKHLAVSEKWLLKIEDEDTK